jgi:CTP synthase
MKHKYIFVVGGVMSGVGKGITTSSIGTLFEARGYKVNIVKADPYLNVDAGTMNPTEHGEVFVLNNGLETDQDMGNYERFMNRDLSELDYMTSGMVYKHVIDKERSLGFKGKCIDADNIRDEIILRYSSAAREKRSDITIIEIGGTIGDYQNIMFIEAARVLKLRHPTDVVFIMVSFLPIPSSLGEMKSKPTQNAIKQLQSYGVQADFIIARSKTALDKKRKEKIAFSCNVPIENVISAPDIASIYDVPLNFQRDKLSEMLSDALGLHRKKIDLAKWKQFVGRVNTAHKEVKIAIVGKYFSTGDFVLSDAYVSVIEALKFSSYWQGAKPTLIWLHADNFEGTPAEVKKALKTKLGKVDGVLVPGGFGETGIEGKLNVICFARENNIPYFGLCYGMQLLVIEYARNVAGLVNAHTSEIDPQAAHTVVDIMEHQKKHLAEGRYGASMRLGAYKCMIKKGTIAENAYRASSVIERHRHRYEVNPFYVKPLAEAGLVFSGTSPDGTLMEIAELPQGIAKGKHPFFVGVQFHPEFLARPLRPHPLFTEFIKAAIKKM